MNLTKEGLRSRFAELQGEIAAIEATAAPLRQERDDLVNAARAAEAEVNARIATAEDGLAGRRQELAMIVRALNGKTGEESGGA